MFKDKKYIVIRNAISYELANFGYNYLLLKREAVKWMQNNNYISKFTPGIGSTANTNVENEIKIINISFFIIFSFKSLIRFRFSKFD